ncbi:MAG: DUF222 domain-containing protein [Propionicimonas sp.]|uniref:HNH endonuclease signature motif containing protein n=1 Tax=Propionicimonas sp. TaxID=1955623 RepID=UPI002B21E139|nr:DUF222 domain-containing protein [Propionicimonas sp.]MEA4945393.1 DUF222 domain-containing protein [Propionicimonas sp.]
MVAQPVESSQLEARLSQLHALVAAIPLAAYSDQTPAEARRTAMALRTLESMLRTHVSAAVRAVDRLVPTRQASQLLAGDFGLDAATAHREIKDARVLAAASAAERAAADGRISLPHAMVIGAALRQLPEQVNPEQRRLAEAQLIVDAASLSPKDLTTRARRITELYDEVEAVDAYEDQLLTRAETRARSRASLSMWDNHDGTWQGRFVLPELQARMLKTVVDAFAAPRRSHLEQLRLSRLERARAEVENDKPYDRKAGEALMALIEHLPTDGLPTTGGTPARIVITIDEAKLRSATPATLATGERISAGQLRRLACSHGILPAVLGGAGIPVELGRSQRLFSAAQRDALAVMDGGCVAPGCDRPPAWCEAHHGGLPFADGGKTDLNQGYLLCSAHHHDAHQRKWRFRRAPDGRAEVDRGRGWERHHRYRP